MTSVPHYARIRSRSTTVVAALSVTLVGTVAGLLGAMLPGSVGLVAETTPDAVYIVTSRGVQFGFGAFALAYLASTGEWERYARFGRPTARDGVAVAVALFALVPVDRAVDGIVDLFGLPSGAVTGTVEHDLALHAEPVLWPLAFVAWFLFAAPAEELFYRGLVQTRLRSSFGTAAVVTLSGACFAASHASFALLSGAGAATATTFVELLGAGLVFGALYEATDDLVPVAVFHALTWLHPIHAVEGLLGSIA